jgi:hypothetical protein
MVAGVAPYPDATAVKVAKLGWVAAAWIGKWCRRRWAAVDWKATG